MQAAKHKAQQTPQMTLALSRASAGLSVFVLALGFALSGLWVGMAAVLAVGALWLLGHLRAPGSPPPALRPGPLLRPWSCWRQQRRWWCWLPLVGMARAGPGGGARGVGSGLVCSADAGRRAVR